MMRNTPPFMKILPLVVVGILLGGRLSVAPLWLVAIAAGLTIGALCIRHKGIGEWYMVAAIVLWASAITVIRAPHSAERPSAPTEHHLTITTTPYTEGRWQRCEASLGGSMGDKILLRADTLVEISLGQNGSAWGYLNPLPEGSYGSLMARRGFLGTLYITSPSDWNPTGQAHTLGVAARRVQHLLATRIDSLHLGADESAVVKAMLLGERSGISSTLRQSYSRTGASHLLAISGLHVGIVAMVVWWLCWLLPLTGRHGHIVRNILSLLVMVLYAFITGLSPSVVRATAMFMIAQMALAYGTKISSLNIISAAATMMLLVNPNNLYDISFQLSVVAVAGIMAGYSPMMEFLGPTKHRWLRALWSVVVIGLCSTLATLPIVAHTFGVVSIVGIVLNPLVIVSAQIIVMCGLIWVTLPLGFLEPLARVLIGGAAQLQNLVVSHTASLPWVAVDVAPPAWLMALIYGAMATLLMVAATRKDTKEWKTEN
ncbi:MAG: ComEC/Rec2 family competence protein [Tidjanibacter sp.]|nr:ComEC/Rec2 family competence protein [Tidjanibacter sp.]